MAAVTVLNAARMLAIEAQSVVGGSIVGNDLILTKYDTSTINAGNVRGPQGTTGIGFVATEIGNAINLNSLLTVGVYTQTTDAEAITGTNYPAPLAGVLEVYTNPTTTLYRQIYTTFASGATYIRTYISGAWTAWRQLVFSDAIPTGLYVATGTSTQSLTSGTSALVTSWTTTTAECSPSTAFVTFSAPSSNWTINQAGIYMIDATVTFASNTSARRIVQIMKNGTEIRRFNAGAGADATIQVNDTAILANTDIITIQAYQNSGGALALLASPTHRFKLVKLS